MGPFVNASGEDFEVAGTSADVQGIKSCVAV